MEIERFLESRLMDCLLDACNAAGTAATVKSFSGVTVASAPAVAATNAASVASCG